MTRGSVRGDDAVGAVVWTVQALLLALTDALAARFSALTVQGELSGLVRAGSGHLYFSLKDHQGQAGLVRCAMFRRAATLVDFEPRDGQQVVLRGRLAVYEARGDLQLIVESMQRVGVGSLYERFIALRDRLRAEGIFEAGRKRAVPAWPQRLGVVTSASGAALRDVLTALRRRSPHVAVVLYPSPVQGAGSVPALVQALAHVSARREVDAVLLVRGGGSLEDLWSFNEEAVVRAVVACSVPVICGVGHETDLTLCDLAADLRAPTPTAAAELAAPMQQALLAQLLQLQGRARDALERRVERQAQALDGLALRLGRPARTLEPHRQGLERLAQRLRRAAAAAGQRQRAMHQQLAWRLLRGIERRRERQRHALDEWQHRLRALDPRSVLQRGYAWVEDEQGRAVVAAATLRPGQNLVAVWHDGRVGVSVRQAPQVSPPPGERDEP